MAVKLRGDTWWIDITSPSGERVRESAKTTNKQLALKLEAKMRLELFQQCQMGVTKDRPFKEAAKYYLEIKRDNRTIAEYEKQLAWWEENFQGLGLQEIDENEIITVIFKKRKEGVANGTLNRYLSVLRATLRAAAGRKWIMKIPVFKLFDEPKARVRWLTDEEQTKLLAACPDKWKAMMTVSLETGLRQGNILKMRWDWVDLEKETLTIPGEFFKNKEDFAIPLSSHAAQVIASKLGEHPDFVFTVDGEPIKQLSSKTWKAILKRAELKNFKWHDLRHTWATRLAQEAIPTQALQMLGGWQSIAMVNKYGHQDIESLRGFVNRSNSAHPTPTAQIRHSARKKHLRAVG
ncbi:XerC Integrase [uncultured Caudovirales phage]|uniref:Integrase n=1 Tax=uncultured Caudovirales phage TaxID=2100421 RepID=A0A6J5RFH6_9CAUD|nr:XerC Integrase [uncultured Caudovirales phage]